MRVLTIPSERDLPRGRLELRKEHLIRHVATTPPAKRAGAGRVALVAIPSLLVLLGAVAFTVYVAMRPADELSAIGCYEEARLDGDVSIVSADGRSPVEICADVFADKNPNVANGPLSASVLENGAVGVFPGGRETCARLALSALAPGYEADAARFAGLRDALLATFSGRRCVGEAEATRIVRRELDARGFRDWRIEVGPGIAGEGFSAERPCASLSFEGDEEMVILVPDVRSG